VAPSRPNRVRIVGGACRGRLVRFPDAPGLRPTPDRVRETLFNWLGQDLSGCSTLDLYAGTGALSLEALSRGATLAVAVDRNARVVAALEANARELGLSGLEAHRKDALTFLAAETRTFDVVFLDPPFADDPWTSLLPACAALLSPSGMIYAEASRTIAPPSGLVLHRTGHAGQVYYHLLAQAPRQRS
jgi:16S rRNA (guanine966-N2)-methyltransferase